MQAYMDRLTDTQAMGFIDKIGDVFKPLPALPKSLLEFLVRVAPYLALLSAILTIIAGPFVGLFGTLASILTLSPTFAIWVVLTLIIMIAQAILMLLAYTPLKNRELKGWVYMFWSEVLGVISAVLSLTNYATGSVIMTLVATAIAFYILFQLRPFYGKSLIKE